MKNLQLFSVIFFCLFGRAWGGDPFLDAEEAMRQRQVAADRVAKQQSTIRPLKIVFVNTKRIFSDLKALEGGRFASDQDVINAANYAIKKLAEKNDLDLVLQDVVWVGYQLDITSHVVNFVHKNITANFDGTPVQAIKLGYVNTQRIFRDLPDAKDAARRLELKYRDRDLELQKLARAAQSDDRLKAEFEAKQSKFKADLAQDQQIENGVVIEKANRAIKRLAEDGRYDLVLQDVVWVTPKIDMTQSVIDAIANTK